MAGIPHPEPISGASYSAVELCPGDTEALLLEQRKLPAVEEYVRVRSADEMARAIFEMVVRGAPAIGIAAAYGMVLAAQSAARLSELEAAGRRLAAARPTAVNLSWAVERMLARARELSPGDWPPALAELARELHRQDVAANRRMGALGAERIADGATILTHCNAGALATGGYGTALGVIRAAVEDGKRVSVLADETRPYLQGSRLTAWELARDGIDVQVIADGASGSLFASGRIDLVVVGSDRIVASGDVANKIGTYTVATLAQAHARPFYVAAPWSTVDLSTPSGDAIVIEQRAESELTHFDARRLIPEQVHALNPAFDVTPAHLVRAIFTERGVVEPVGPEALRALA